MTNALYRVSSYTDPFGKTIRYTYDAVGNLSRLTYPDNTAVSYDYDETNRLRKVTDWAGRVTGYTYDAEDVRIRNLCGDETTTYTYNTNVKLSQLLMKMINGIVTKYVYGLGLIGEECGGAFKTYHFDNRGSTVAITDASGNPVSNIDPFGLSADRWDSYTVHDFVWADARASRRKAMHL